MDFLLGRLRKYDRRRVPNTYAVFDAQAQPAEMLWPSFIIFHVYPAVKDIRMLGVESEVPTYGSIVMV